MTAPANAARAVMRAHIDALNARDEAALARTLHFPHVRLSGANLQTWDTPDSYFSDFRDRAGDMWSHSTFSDIQIIQSAPAKVHLTVTVNRYDTNGSLLTTFPSLWIITLENGRWAAKLRSTFAAL